MTPRRTLRKMSQTDQRPVPERAEMTKYDKINKIAKIAQPKEKK
jgi:hypothetical protein